jgi:hypothetical protein
MRLAGLAPLGYGPWPSELFRIRISCGRCSCMQNKLEALLESIQTAPASVPPPLCRYALGLNVSLPRRKRPSWSLNAAVLLLICIQNVGALVSHKRHKSDGHLGSTGKGPWLVAYFRSVFSGLLEAAGTGSSGWGLQLRLFEW